MVHILYRVIFDSKVVNSKVVDSKYFLNSIFQFHMRSIISRIRTWMLFKV